MQTTLNKGQCMHTIIYCTYVLFFYYNLYATEKLKIILHTEVYYIPFAGAVTIRHYFCKNKLIVH